MTVPKDTNPLGLPAEINGVDDFLSHLRRGLALVDTDQAIRASVGKAVVGNPITVELVPTAERWAEKQIRKSQEAGNDWVEGVQRPSRSFKEAGIAAAGKHKNNTQLALNEDRYRKGMAKTNEDEAIATAVKVGASGYTAGIAARTDKIRRVVTELQPKVAALKRTIDAMPQDTDAQREERLKAARRGMMEIGKSRIG